MHGYSPVVQGSCRCDTMACKMVWPCSEGQERPRKTVMSSIPLQLCLSVLRSFWVGMPGWGGFLNFPNVLVSVLHFGGNALRRSPGPTASAGVPKGLGQSQPQPCMNHRREPPPAHAQQRGNTLHISHPAFVEAAGRQLSSAV